MLASQIPVKFQIPFANNAGSAFINAIPQASQIGIVAGAASLVDGFPPVTFLPVGAGGTPPWGRDFNGLLNQVTAWNRWQGAGGLCTFDATFSAAVGGYPKGALLASATAGNAWVSLNDNNTTDPNATPGAPGWAAVAFITPIQNGSYISGDDTGSADAYVTSPSPAPAAYVKYQRFQVKIANTNQTSTPTLNVTGLNNTLLGAKTIIHPNGGVLNKGELAAGMIANFIFDGTFFQLMTGVGGGASSILPNIQIFTASSTYTPTTGAQKALVFATGGGGGGGAGTASRNGGGGAGATAISLVPISFGSVPIIIGAGGIGNLGAGGNNGGNTSFGSFVVANGGSGGPNGIQGGVGAMTGVGSLIIPGGDGTSVASSGGDSAGTGGSSFWGGGGSGGVQVNFGNPGRAYGSGGGASSAGVIGTGGAGASGVVFIMEF